MRDHIAIITGAARGIGFAAAARLFSEGAITYLLDRDPSVENAALGLDPSRKRAIGLKADIGSAEEINEAVALIIARHQRVDILITAAGIFPAQPFEATAFEQWRHVMSVNLDGTFLSCQAVYRHMRARTYGRIITIASATVQKGSANFAAYAASKGGVIGLTRVIATEGGPYGITANAVAPGIIATETVTGLPQGQAILEGTLAGQVVKRNGQPADIASIIAYLSSPGSGFITGQTINVNGGSFFS